MGGVARRAPHHAAAGAPEPPPPPTGVLGARGETVTEVPTYLSPLLIQPQHRTVPAVTATSLATQIKNLTIKKQIIFSLRFHTSKLIYLFLKYITICFV